MEKAVASVEGGESIRRAAEKFGIPRSTLHDRTSGKVQMDAQPGKKPYLSIAEEEELALFFQRCAKIGYPHSRQQILGLVQQLTDSKGMKCTVTEGWWQRFSGRHPQLALRTAIPLAYSRAVATDRDVITRYYDLLEETLSGNGIMNAANQIYNCDETGLPLSPKPLKVVDSKGAKHPSYVTGDTKSQITVLACVCAGGSAIPPCIVFDRKSLNPELAINEVPGTFYGLSSKGWMDSELFNEWFIRHFLAYAPPIRPLLLLLDGHSSHYCPEFIRIAAAQKVLVFVLPPHTTHLTQPLDKSAFGSLKVCWRKICHNFIAKNPGRTITRYDFNTLFSQAWYQALTMKNVISGFKIAGVCPFNRSAICIPDEETCSTFDPSLLPERSGLAYIPLYSPVRPHPPATKSSFEREVTRLQNTSLSDSELQNRSLSDSELNVSSSDVCVMLPLQKSSSISGFLNIPKVPSKLPTVRQKSSGRVLTSKENLEVIEEKERKKQEEKRLKEERKRERERKKQETERLKEDRKRIREKARAQRMVKAQARIVPSHSKAKQSHGESCEKCSYGVHDVYLLQNFLRKNWLCSGNGMKMATTCMMKGIPCGSP